MAENETAVQAESRECPECHAADHWHKSWCNVPRQVGQRSESPARHEFDPDAWRVCKVCGAQGDVLCKQGQQPRSVHTEAPEPEKGRWWGPEFCQIPADQQPIMDGCYFCGRPVHCLNGEHNHTMSEKEGFRGATRTRYSCVCDYC